METRTHKMVSIRLSHIISAAVVLAVSRAWGAVAAPSGWDGLDHEAREILARATPAAPHFVVYSDEWVSGETGPPSVSSIKGFNVLYAHFPLLRLRPCAHL